MAYFLETISHPSAGIKTRNIVDNATGIPFTPSWYRITAGPKSGGTNFAATSEGSFSGTLQTCDSVYIDAARVDMPSRYNDRVVFVREWNGAAYVAKVHATHDSIPANQIKYNVVTADVNYQFKIEAGN